VTFARAALKDCIHELKPLFQQQWDAMDGELGDFDFNEEAYLHLDSVGSLRVFLLRVGETIAGYAVFVITKALHQKSVSIAVSDCIWLDPSHRGKRSRLALTLLGDAEDALFAEGIQRIYIEGKQEHPALQRVLHKMGYGPAGFSCRKDRRD
jgi:GNAT superfamily N-acetyltransferase